MVRLIVREMAISKFKATCLAVLEDVRRTREPVRITRRGQPMAEVVPPAAVPADGWLGAWRGQIRILGDIVAPAADPEEWEAVSNPDRVLNPELPSRRRKR
ncbi:MAG: type II toxin-antitoxin system Phd/YefM family antitoxin [Terriglobales bacterium]